MTHRAVTELDFRQPQFRNAKVEDYEFRQDGQLVRKDRWETAVQAVRELVGIDGREFEIDDVVERVRVLVEDGDWTPVDEETPPENTRLDIRLQQGSVLLDATYASLYEQCTWAGAEGAIVALSKIEAWRMHKTE